MLLIDYVSKYHLASYFFIFTFYGEREIGASDFQNTWFDERILLETKMKILIISLITLLKETTDNSEEDMIQLALRLSEAATPEERRRLENEFEREQVNAGIQASLRGVPPQSSAEDSLSVASTATAGGGSLATSLDSSTNRRESMGAEEPIHVFLSSSGGTTSVQIILEDGTRVNVEIDTPISDLPEISSLVKFYLLCNQRLILFAWFMK